MSSGAGDSEGEHSSAVRCGHGDTQQSTSYSDRDIVSVINIYFDLFISYKDGFLGSMVLWMAGHNFECRAGWWLLLLFAVEFKFCEIYLSYHIIPL